MEEQVFIEWRKYEYLRKVLSDSLMVCHIMPTPILAGYLSLNTKRGWKNFYCALFKKYFQYYNPKDKVNLLFILPSPPLHSHPLIIFFLNLKSKIIIIMIIMIIMIIIIIIIIIIITTMIKKKLPIGVIGVKFISDLENRNNETDFRVVTAVCAYNFRAKHSSARQSWMTAIADTKALKKNGGSSPLPSLISIFHLF